MLLITVILNFPIKVSIVGSNLLYELSPSQALFWILKNDGILALFDGLGPTIVRRSLDWGIRFRVSAAMKRILLVRKKQKLASTNTTGYRGVSKGKKNTFRARISIGNSQQKLIGTFDTAIQAALAYDQAAIKAGKKKSKLNFPDGLPIKQESDIDDGTAFWV